MTSEKNKFLPVGTVVKLKEEEKRVMIIGFYPMAMEERKIYHYVACLYPEGILDSSKLIMFDDAKIEKICYKGFVDEEETEFKNKLIKFA